MEQIVVFIIIAVAVALALKFLGKSMKVIVTVLLNALVGGVIIWILNIFGLGIAFNWLNAILVGFLGVPGVIIVLILKFVFHI